MTSLAIPEPAPSLDIRGVCAAVAEWAATVEDASALADADAKLAAIATYLSHTSRQGLAEVENTRRRLEVRIGELTPREQGKRSDLETTCPHPGQVPERQRAAEFRQMAEHRDVVEQVMATATDDRPATRSRVLGAIAEVKRAREMDAEEASLRDALEARGYDLDPPAEKVAQQRRENAVVGAVLVAIEDMVMLGEKYTAEVCAEFVHDPAFPRVGEIDSCVAWLMSLRGLVTKAVAA